VSEALAPATVAVFVVVISGLPLFILALINLSNAFSLRDRARGSVSPDFVTVGIHRFVELDRIDSRLLAVPSTVVRTVDKV